jgi:hypothetical protein
LFFSKPKLIILTSSSVSFLAAILFVKIDNDGGKLLPKWTQYISSIHVQPGAHFDFHICLIMVLKHIAKHKEEAVGQLKFTTDGVELNWAS